MSVRTQSGRPQAIDGSNADSDPSQPLPLNDVCHLLQNERRRNALRYIREVTDSYGADDEAVDSIRMRDVAEHVAAWEYDTTVEQLDHDERKRVYIALYQCHLPKLDDAGVIEYDRERGDIVPTDAIQELLLFLDWFDDRARDPDTTDRDDDRDLETEDGVGEKRSASDRHWLRYYSGAVAGAVGLVLLSTVAGIGVAVPDGVVTALVVTIFAAVVGAHYFFGSREE